MTLPFTVSSSLSGLAVAALLSHTKQKPLWMNFPHVCPKSILANDRRRWEILPQMRERLGLVEAGVELRRDNI
jgi:hypothetical protein